jgi:DeoR family suf operon transcriptional repressor
MANTTATSDDGLIDLLRQRGPLSITALSAATRVTPTAVRQRLNRLMGQGLIDRQVTQARRGRPSHQYSLTPKGQRSAGDNFADLAVVLWQEIRAVKDAEIRRGLLQRLAIGMAGLYRRQVEGETPAERMRSVAKLFAERSMPLIVEEPEAGVPDEQGVATHEIVAATGLNQDANQNAFSKEPAKLGGGLPVLTALACPYPTLAEQDRGICAVERMLFSELIGSGIHLAECRLDGSQCCRFTMN